jgi:hypothetical protein
MQVPTAVPFVALVLVAMGIVSRALPWREGTAPVSWRVLGHAGLWAVSGIVMSITPEASWYGRPVRIPHTLLAEWVPLYGTLRQTTRLGVAGLMGLSLAAGLGFALCAARLPLRGRHATLAAALFAFVVGAEMYREYRAPGPFGRAQVPREYPLRQPPANGDAIVRAVALGNGPVLEVPAGLVPAHHAEAMYRAIFHRRPLLNGYGGYWPDGFAGRMELAARLPDRAALTALRQQTGLTTVVVNPAGLSLAELGAWRWLFKHGAPGLRASGPYDGVLVFDVRDR